jgi:hypothetical protein
MKFVLVYLLLSLIALAFWYVIVLANGRDE